MKSWKISNQIMGVVLAALAVAGLVASFVLLHETFEVAKNPDYAPSCNINPLVSCSSVMSRPESEVFGLPFSAFGVLAFGALLVFGILLAAGTKFTVWIWRAGIAACIAGLLAIGYMIWLSMFSFNTICPWCFAMWLTTISIFWAFMTYIAAARPYKLSKKCDKTAKIWTTYAPMILVGMVIALVFMLVLRFNESIF